MIKKKLPFIQHDTLVRGIAKSPRASPTNVPEIKYFPNITKATQLQAALQHQENIRMMSQIIKKQTSNKNSNQTSIDFDWSKLNQELKAIHITPAEKFELQRVSNENKRLYSRILNIDNQLQFAYLGLNSNRYTQKSRVKEAGLNFKSDAGNSKGILEKDRILFNKGGHSSKVMKHSHREIDIKNDRILKSLQQQKSIFNPSKY